jgi:hypothetical protein
MTHHRDKKEQQTKSSRHGITLLCLMPRHAIIISSRTRILDRQLPLAPLGWAPALLQVASEREFRPGHVEPHEHTNNERLVLVPRHFTRIRQ